MKARRAVVTGLGVVSPVGIGADVAWDALVAGQSGIADITLFDTTGYDVHVAGEVKGFDVSQYMDAKDARRHDRNTHLAVAASGEALRDAGLLNGDALDASQADRDRFGMVVGTGIGGCSFALIARSAKYGIIDCGRSVSTIALPAAAISLNRVSTVAGVNCASIAS